MAPYNSVTSTPSELDGRGTSSALFGLRAPLGWSRAAYCTRRPLPDGSEPLGPLLFVSCLPALEVSCHI